MTPKLLIRLAAGCLLFFALGHSVGHSSRHEAADAKGREVLQMMSDYKFDMFGSMRSYDDNYTGMSLNLIFTLLAFVVLLWILSGYAHDHRKLSSALLIPVLLCVAGFAVTGFLYFFLVPAVTCLFATILLAISIVKLR